MSVYTSDAFAERVNFAARVIASRGTATRSFDTCFEMWDGDAVGVALYRRARGNTKLRANLFRYCARDSLVPLAFANRRRKDLKGWAAELRAQARRESDAFFARIEAERAASAA